MRSASAGMRFPDRRRGGDLSPEALLGGGPDLLLDLVRQGLGIDDDAALGLVRRDAQESLAQTLVEADMLGLETIDLLGERASSRRGPGQPDLGRHVEDEGQVRLRRVDDDALEARQELRLEPAVAALVGARRIGEAVAQHEGAALKRRADLRLEMVAPRRREQKRLGEPAERLCAAGQDGVADAPGALRSAGLP